MRRSSRLFASKLDVRHFSPLPPSRSSPALLPGSWAGSIDPARPVRMHYVISRALASPPASTSTGNASSVLTKVQLAARRKQLPSGCLGHLSDMPSSDQLDGLTPGHHPILPQTVYDIFSFDRCGAETPPLRN